MKFSFNLVIYYYIDRRVAGTTRSVDDADRRRRRTVLPTGVASSVKYRGAAPLRQRYMSIEHGQFVLDALRHPQPVKVHQERCDVVYTCGLVIHVTVWHVADFEVT